MVYLARYKRNFLLISDKLLLSMSSENTRQVCNLKQATFLNCGKLSSNRCVLSDYSNIVMVAGKPSQYSKNFERLDNPQGSI